jgi:DNA polymerase
MSGLTVEQHSALDDIHDAAFGVRAAIAPELSEVYVPGEGNNPRVMIIGEAPGAQEEVYRRPFVGASGRILRELMTGVELFTGDTPHFGEPNCWLTNAVKFRPPRNRKPTDTEVMGFRYLLQEEWGAIGMPQVIVPVGGVALMAVMGRKMSILRMAGKRLDMVSRKGLPIFIWPMIHPSFGLREKSIIPLIEKDWDKFGHWMWAL